MRDYANAFRKTAKSIGSDRSANVAVLFGLALLPMIGMIGLGIDYSSANSAKRKLDAAADAAVLNAVSRSANPNLGQPTQDQVQSTFLASLGRAPNISVSSVQLNSAVVNGNLQVSVSFVASMNTTFGTMFAVPTIGLSGTAISTAPLPSYSNFYFLLDNSPSMGLGATKNDITKLQAVNSGCAFACHMHAFSNSGFITGDNLNDSYHLAKSSGVQTRIDVVRTASQDILGLAQSLENNDTRYQAAIYTFSDVLQQVAPLSSSLSTVKAAAANIDLAYAYYDQRNTQTAFDTALSDMTTIVGSGGDGQSSSSPLKYLLIITDGVEDEPMGKRSGPWVKANNTGDVPDHWAAPNQTTYSPPADASPNLVNNNIGNVPTGYDQNNNMTYNRFITTLSPSQCDTLKNNNVRIAVLYTTYQPVPTDSTYSTYVAPIISAVPNKLQQCASPNLFFTVDPTQDISAAMSNMFYAVATGQPRLTN